MTPNPAFEPTRNGWSLQAPISFWAFRAQPLLAAQLRRYASKPMFRVSLFIAIAAGVAGCSTTPVATEIVESWGQRPEERGRLPVGRVVSVERVDFTNEHRGLSKEQQAGIAGGMGVGPGIAIAAAINSVRTADAIFRTKVQLKTGEEWVRELNYMLKPGDCIAFRSGLTADDVLAIPALPGECS
ncbi:hypothetical protein [Roseateles albus]|uniref:Uncharacterized protein n=1 Tax=Roseateles albus TaxID=2987525 RepID=A0ABT5K9C8_9BURK|nr:hypothetical protein [Roseateles albus]MDC8770533.1 hypothetical protein [Roseateles albus]